jgi:hypothetical protein
MVRPGAGPAEPNPGKHDNLSRTQALEVAKNTEKDKTARPPRSVPPSFSVVSAASGSCWGNRAGYSRIRSPGPGAVTVV